MDNSVIYNRIYALSLEWGSNWRKPINKIVKEEYPSLTDEQQEQISSYIEDRETEEIDTYICHRNEKSLANWKRETKKSKTSE